MYIVKLLLESLTGDSRITIENLDPNTTFNIKVSAKNKVGEGPTKTWSRTTKKIGPPEPPVFITDAINGVAFSEYHNKMTVQWAIPEDNGRPIENYEINYIRVNN